MSKLERCERHPIWVPAKEHSCIACLTERADNAEDESLRLRARVAELEGALRDLCDEVEAAGLAAVRARRLVKEEVEP